MDKPISRVLYNDTRSSCLSFI